MSSRSRVRRPSGIILLFGRRFVTSQQGIAVAPTAGQRPTHVRYMVVAFCIVLAIITYIDRVSLSFAAPYIRKDLGISESQMGWIFFVFAWAYALFEIPGGYMGDRIGPRKVDRKSVV